MIFLLEIIKIIMSEDKKNPKDKEEKIEYEYFKDTEGRLKRFRKDDYTKRRGYIRLKFLEKSYIWWRRKSFDFKNALIPWFLGFTGCYIIYKMSMIWSQNDLNREVKAKLPFDYTRETVSEMKKVKKYDD